VYNEFEPKVSLVKIFCLIHNC